MAQNQEGDDGAAFIQMAQSLSRITWFLQARQIHAAALAQYTTNRRSPPGDK